MRAVATVGDIMIITEENLYFKGFIKVLEEELLEYKIRPINYEQLLLYKDSITSTDLIIFDMEIGLNIFELIDYCRKEKIKIVTWASNRNEEQAIKFLRLNLDGYFFDPMDLNELRIAIESVRSGNKYIQPYLVPFILEDYARLSCVKVERPKSLLSKREWDVLEEMVLGHHNKTIADNLIISEKTVKNHVSHILRKLEVEDRTSAVVKAIKNKWVNIY